MKSLFKKASENYQYILLGASFATLTTIAAIRKSKDKIFESNPLQEAILILRRENAIKEVLGSELTTKEGLISSIGSSKTKSPSLIEYAVGASGKRSSAQLNIVLTGKTHREIEESPEADKLRGEYFITEENPKDLPEQIPASQVFWKLSSIRVFSSRGQFQVKVENELEDSPRKTKSDLIAQVEKNHTDLNRNMKPEELRQEIDSIFFKKAFEKRMMLTFLMGSYLAMLGAFISIRNFKMKRTSIAYSDLLSKVEKLTTKTLPVKEKIYFNPTSIGCESLGRGDFSLQFYGKTVAGATRFRAQRNQAGSTWSISKGQVHYDVLKAKNAKESFEIPLSTENN